MRLKHRHAHKDTHVCLYKSQYPFVWEFARNVRHCGYKHVLEKSQQLSTSSAACHLGPVLCHEKKTISLFIENCRFLFHSG